MKTLIAYASRYGQTQKIATSLQQQLVDIGIDCRLTTCRELLGRHDFLTESSAVILGSPIYYGAMDRDLELTDWTQVHAFGNQFTDGLMGKPIADEGLKSASRGV